MNRSASTDKWYTHASGTLYKPKEMYIAECLFRRDDEGRSGSCPNRSFTTTSNTGNHWMAGDLNGDGRDDLINIVEADVYKICTLGCQKYYRPAAIGTAISLGDGTYAQRMITPTDWNKLLAEDYTANAPYDAYWFPGDFDGDGKTDIIGAGKSKNHKVLLLAAISDGNGAFSFSHQETDVAWQDAYVKESAFSKFMSNANITISAGTTFGGGFQGISHSFSGSILFQGKGNDVYISQRWFSGDVNGDGRTDLTLSNPSSTEPGATISLCNFVSTGDLSEDKARSQSSQAIIYADMSRLMLRRLTRV